MEMSAKLFSCITEEQLKHFCAIGQHHERQRERERGGGGGWRSSWAAESSPYYGCVSLPARCVDEMHKRHPEQFLPGSGTVAQDRGAVVYTAGRAAKSFFGVGTVCVVPALPSAGKVQCVRRACRDRYYPAPIPRIPMRGEGLTDTLLCKYFFIKT